MKRKLYPYKCISVDGEYYIFTSKSNRLINISQTYYEVLVKGEKNDFFIEICEEDKQKECLIEDFEKFELFESEENKKYFDDEKSCSENSY